MYPQQLQQPQQQPPVPGTTIPQASLPVPGNIPYGFDASNCRSVYVGNVHPNATEALLSELFSSVGPLESCKLIKKEKSSFGFVDFYDNATAATALQSLNGRLLFGMPIKVNWAFSNSQREDTSGHCNIFVGDLSGEVTDAALYAAFSIFPSLSNARVMWDQNSGRSRGFGFISFRNQADAEAAIAEMNGKWLGSRPIRCNWSTSKPGGGGPSSSSSGVSGNGTVAMAGADGRTDGQNGKDSPDGNPVYTTVYVGNLSHQIGQDELHREFYALGAGVIEEVRVQKEKGFAFIRYQTHEQAAMAISLGNGRVIGGRAVRCSWGSRPSTSSHSLGSILRQPQPSMATSAPTSGYYAAAAAAPSTYGMPMDPSATGAPAVAPTVPYGAVADAGSYQQQMHPQYQAQGVTVAQAGAAVYAPDWSAMTYEQQQQFYQQQHQQHQQHQVYQQQMYQQQQPHPMVPQQQQQPSQLHHPALAAIPVSGGVYMPQQQHQPRQQQQLYY